MSAQFIPETTADIIEVTDKRYVTEAEKAAIAAAVPNTRTINGLPLSADITIAASTGGIASSYLFCEDVVFAGTTPVWHELEKQSDGGTAGVHTFTTTAYVEGDRYVTAALNTDIIPAGLWNFTLFGFTSVASSAGQLRAQIYRVNSAGAIVGGVLGTAETAAFANTSAAGIPCSIYIAAQSGWALTDRVGVVISGKRNGGAATITFAHNLSTGLVSMMHTPITLLHNQFNGLNQGDYQHLTAAEKSYALSGIDWSAGDISITTTANLTIGRHHICSGTTADYTVTLPAVSGNSGKMISIAMSGALTKLITVDGSGSETIDGALTRIMWANETALLYCNGTNWTKVAGKSIPMIAAMRLSDNQSVAHTTSAKILINQVDIQCNAMANATDKRIDIKRPGTYEVVGLVYLNTGPTYYRAMVVILKGGADAWVLETSAVAGGYPTPQILATIDLAAGNYLELYTYHNNSASAAELALGATTGSSCFMAITEAVKW